MHGCQHSHKHTVNDATYTRSRSLPHTDPRSLSAEQQHFHARRAASRRTKKHYYFFISTMRIEQLLPPYSQAPSASSEHKGISAACLDRSDDRKSTKYIRPQHPIYHFIKPKPRSVWRAQNEIYGMAPSPLKWISQILESK